jgi:Ni/Co efflux regulator RcnB
MKHIFAIAVVAFSAASIASGQKQDAIRDQERIVEQAIRKLDNERVQAQIHADAAALDRIYADDLIGVGPSGTSAN